MGCAVPTDSMTSTLSGGHEAFWVPVCRLVGSMLMGTCHVLSNAANLPCGKSVAATMGSTERLANKQVWSNGLQAIWHLSAGCASTAVH